MVVAHDDQGLLALRMRREVEIRNRHLLKVLCENCAQGSAMVSWLVSTGHFSDRSTAAAECHGLVLAKLVHPVGAPPRTFRDADSALYRFWCDEPSQGGLLQNVSLKKHNNDHQVSTSPLSVVREDEEEDEDEDRWEFAAHTSHNSLALNVALAEDLASLAHRRKRDGSAWPSAEAEQKLRELRRNVRSVLDHEALGWTPKGRVHTNGAVVSRRTREPRGHYYTIRTDGVVSGVSAEVFTKEFLDFETRSRWEPSFSDGTVVEQGMFDAIEDRKKQERLENPPSVDWDKVDLTGRPEGMSIAIFEDSDTLRESLRRTLDPSVETLCGRCSAKLKETPREACPTCAVVVCKACRARLAWDVARKVELRICRYCYARNPNIFHPAISDAGATTKLGTWWNMADVAGDLQQLGYDSIEQLLACSDAGMNHNAQCPPTLPPERQEEGRKATIPAPPVVKWSKCMRCGERVARTMEAMDEHTEACVMGLLPHDLEMSEHDTLGGVPRTRTTNVVSRYSSSPSSPQSSSSTSSYPRIIYRTAMLPKSTLNFRPRQVCAFQDSFVEEDVASEGEEKGLDGTRYVYEISVRHGRVSGEPNHVTAEVLLLAHAARPLSSSETELTVVSQVDARRNSRAPGWMVALLHGQDSRFGALAVFDSPAAASTRKIYADDDNDEEKEKTVGLSDFELVAVLGRGGFGTVMQVRKKSSGRVFAMKVFKKAELRRRRQVERTRTERDIIQHAHHPYIVKLRYAFQTETKLYMVMDFAQGGDFFSFFRRFKNGIDEGWARIYLAELSLALQHLHDMSVVYRDLKPENVLMDSEGHALLADFGLSRDFAAREPDNLEKMAASKSYCGTEQYMAPEMLLHRGHTFAVDWWGLGLLAHEMMASRHPFQGATRAGTLRNMVRSHPDLDPKLSKAATSLIRRLLAKRVHERLCGIEAIKSHAFFSAPGDLVDFFKLEKRQVPAPYVPDVTSELDTSNFDAEFTREGIPEDSTAASTMEAAELLKKRPNVFDLFRLNFRQRDGKSPTIAAPLDVDDAATDEEAAAREEHRDRFEGFSYYYDEGEEDQESSSSPSSSSF